MNIITANVGQGALAIVRHNGEAIIVDCQIPPSDDDTTAYVKELFAVSLRDHYVKGLILTGIRLRPHRDRRRVAHFAQIPPRLDHVSDLFQGQRRGRAGLRAHRSGGGAARRVDETAEKAVGARRQAGPASNPGLSTNFAFELFSPHIEDMDNSNNCSIVLKLTGLGLRGFSYLITGDTEIPRWETINRLFGDALKSHVLAAPHHGSKNAVHPAALLNIAPHTVLISAGVDSQYDHPSPEALRVYSRVAKRVFRLTFKAAFPC